MPIYALGDLEPVISSGAYVHPDAVVIGAVTIGDDASIWPGAVLRGDHGVITIGRRTSIQDGTIVHVTEEWPTTVADDCVVGHNAHLEGCTVEPRSLIGSGSVVLNRARVGPGAVVGAAALVPEDFMVPTGQLALGVPAKLRALPAQHHDWVEFAIQTYVDSGRHYRQALRRLD
jgi:carbonic anhydrase/acetyltransferase-like protein (isoleucine patch superfamily)